jgi:tRNA(His) 5'-end guanylyltransferase
VLQFVLSGFGSETELCSVWRRGSVLYNGRFRKLKSSFSDC